jgi:hypothetical protein
VRTCGSIGPVPTAAIIARSRSEAPFDLALGDCADGPAGRPPRSCQHTRSTGHRGKGKPNQQHKNRQLSQARARFRRSAHCSRTQLGGGVNATHHCCRARPGALGAPAAPLARLGGRARAAAPSAAAAALGSGGGGVAAPAPATPGRPATPAAAAPALGLGRTALGVPQGQLVSAPCLVACTHGDSIRVLG